MKRGVSKNAASGTKPLTSLDLFSGCAGITHALRGVAEPVAYCEINESAQGLLRTLMSKNDIPTAEIKGDVTKLDGTPYAGKVQLIAGGFPCVGISTAGLRKGLDDPGSGLFRQVVRLATEIQPEFLFLENVGAITQVNSEKQLSVLQEVIAELDVIGYDLQWIVLPAYQVGSPQRRKRWFGLCYKRGMDFGEITFPKWTKFDWTKEPTRMVPKTDRKRACILGNSVVPDVVTLAFRLLWTGLTLSVDQAEALEGPAAFKVARIGKPTKVPGKVGVSREGVWYDTMPPKGMIEQPDYGIVLDPAVMPFNHAYKGDSRLTEPTTVPLWPTPRYGNGWLAGRTLTKRAKGDLATVMRFARSTPDSQRTGNMNPVWIEYLMGYPAGWTEGA